MKYTALLLAVVAAYGQSDHVSGPRMTPPTIRTVAPMGASRGTTVEMTVEGFNLAGASKVFFSEAGVTGKIVRVKELPDLPDIRIGSNGTPSTIDVGPLPPRNQVTLEIDIAPEAHVGPVSFRIQTPLGTSPTGSFLVEPYYGEAPDNEPNDLVDNAFETFLPAVLAGTISKPGDIDNFKIKAAAGQSLTFDNSAALVGSQLQPVVAILAADQTVLAEFGNDGGLAASSFHFKFDKAGTYYVRVGDYQQKGSAGHFYRIKVGEFPLMSSAFPLGIRRGEMKSVALRGMNLGSASADVSGRPTEEEPDTVILRPKLPTGVSFNEVKLDLGFEPEVQSTAKNASPATAQAVTLPVTVNGIIRKDEYFRFAAKKDEKIVVEVKARRFGSELDSFVEVLDLKGKPVPQLTARPVWETITVLRDHDSAQRGLRIQSWNALKTGDYVMCGSEIMRIEAMPRTPDDDAIMEAFGGQRLAYFGTTPEAHAIDKAVYKVQIHPPGRQFSPNGLPLARIDYRNDDGGPGYGKDSYLVFTPPADGEYIVRLGDVRGLSADDFGYRLTMRAPRPDFRLSVLPRNPNVPAGGTIPLTVTAQRLDGFEGPINLILEDLPAGITAGPATIGAGQVSGTLVLSAAPNVPKSEAAPLKAVGTAKIGAEQLARTASPDDRLKLIAVAPKPDVVMMSETKEVELVPGGTAEVKVRITRQNGFGGRVPVEIRNLPPRVRVLDVGLNGVLINETETERSFTLEALPMAEDVDQLIYVSGNVETRSNQQNAYAAPQAIRLKVRRPPPTQ